MTEQQRDYEKKRARFDSVRDKVSKGPLPAPQGFSQEAEYQDAFRQMDRARSSLIATGQWSGPVPIPLRRKHRG